MTDGERQTRTSADRVRIQMLIILGLLVAFATVGGVALTSAVNHAAHAARTAQAGVVKANANAKSLQEQQRVLEAQQQIIAAACRTLAGGHVSFDGAIDQLISYNEKSLTIPKAQREQNIALLQSLKLPPVTCPGPILPSPSPSAG